MDNNQSVWHLDKIKGAGLGLRSEFISELLAEPISSLDFLEIVPENWLEVYGHRRHKLVEIAQQYPIIAHGLNLSIGSPAPLNIAFIESLKIFFEELQINHYSEHLSYCSDENGYLYDLLPIPFTDEAVMYVSQRIKQVQQQLNMHIAFENSSYYYAPNQHLSELEFINGVINESNCLLLLYVNNVYVNSQNHNYDPYDFINKLPTDKIAYIHVAGHWQKSTDLIIDTHGAPVIKSVWDLLEYAYKVHGIKPTLLERDSEIPPLTTLLQEVNQIRKHQQLELMA
jgi:uncharacterized protein (UPF0276 family)